jgi:GTP-binding protein
MQKSTLISALSAARPKVADYPFTTLHPNLGVVSVDLERSFVMADIPGLIEGAAEGAGLGIQFLKHLQRTRLLLHLVEIPADDDEDVPVAAVRSLEKELARFSAELAEQPRWLVLNKLDLCPEESWDKRLQNLMSRLGWNGPAYAISAVTGQGTDALKRDVMNYLEEAGEETGAEPEA